MRPNPRSIRRQLEQDAGQLVRKRFVRQGPDGALRAVQRVVQESIEALPREDRSPVACAAGCDFCCHLRVMATPIEVFALLDYLREQLAVDVFDDFKARVDQTERELRDLAPDTVLSRNLACPALDAQGRCRGYAARPLNCRSYHSVSREACEESFRHPDDMNLGHPQYTAVAKVHEGAQSGFIKAFAAEGRDARQYELVTALAEAMNDPQSRVRYNAGEPAFLHPLSLPA